jgi:fibulin 1/2
MLFIIAMHIDFSDINECEDNTHHKDCHSCVNTEGSYTCRCRYGYELDPITKQRCIGELCGVGVISTDTNDYVVADIDECKGTRGTHYHQDCHKCINTIGSYTCECDEYYKLDPNEPKCIGENAFTFYTIENQGHCFNNHTC